MKLKTLIVIGLMCLPILAKATLTARVNQTQISQTDIVNLTIQKTGSSHSDADLSPLKQDFAVLGTSTGNSIQVINGNMTSSSTIQLQLSPKHAGSLTIPALTWDGETTQAIAINVSPQANSISSSPSASLSASQTGSRHVFFDIKSNKATMYFGGARLLTVRLYTDQQLTQAGLSFPSNTAVNVQQLGSDKSGTEVKNGQPYQYIERLYILTPQKSGDLTIDGPILDAQVLDQTSNPNSQDPLFDQFLANSPLANMMSMRPMRLQAKPITLEVKPKPINIAQQDWLPTQHLKLSASWDTDKSEVAAGEPINLHLHLEGNDVNATQLPDLATKLQLPAGIKAYPNQAKSEVKVEDGQLLAVKDQNIALIGQSTGEFKLPAIEVSWWDTVNNTLQKATIAARTLTILSAINAGNTSSTPKTQVTTANAKPPQQELEQYASSALIPSLSRAYWWLALAIVFLIIFLIYAWRKFKKPQTTQTDHHSENSQNAQTVASISRASALKTLEQTLRDNNSKLARSALLDWAKTVWPETPPLGLIALADKLESPALKDLILRLDRACYSNEVWQGEGLYELIQQWKAKNLDKSKSNLIAELYV